MKISRKFKPLFEVIRGEHPEVDNVVVTGGRDSSKSFTTSTAICDGVVNHNHRVLYTRYTLTSAKDSIIPDFTEKVEILGYSDWLHETGDRLLCTHNKGKVVFKGFKTSQGNQTATLKSLKDFSMLVCEEMEEFPSYDEWDKVQLSIRATDVHALNILILNPTSRKHWVFREFFEDKGVPPGFNGIKGNTLYIHVTYLDVEKEFIAPKNWRKYEAARKVFEVLDKLSNEEREQCEKKDIKQYKYYKHVVLGGWLDSVEGTCIKEYETYDELPKYFEGKKDRVLGLDFGYAGHPAALVEVKSSPEDIYFRQHIYQTGLLNHQLAEMINVVVGDKSAYVVADHANPDKIDDINRIVKLKGYNFVVIPCDKGKGSVKDGLDSINDKNIHIHKDSKDMIDEANLYHQIEIVNNKGETVYHIVDKDNHAWDAGRYAYTKFY